MDEQELYGALESRATGLRKEEVAARHHLYGKNKLPEGKRKTILGRFLDQFKDFLILILLFAGVVSFLMGSVSDAAIILSIVCLNALVGFLQEFKAERALEALQKLMAPLCTVVRDGKEERIKADELVPGDILVLEEGSRIPADARILEAVQLTIDESILTGESVPLSKNAITLGHKELPLTEQANMLFMGTVVAHGRATAIVTATGKHTEFGKIAKLTQDIHELDSPLTVELDKIGRGIGWFTLFLCITIFFLGILGFINIPISPAVMEGVRPYLAPIQGLLPFLDDRLVAMLWSIFTYSIAVAVAVVPEGLATTVTVALALGVRRMATKRAIIKKLKSVETLGCTTVICSDKTGTLTKNQMTVQRIFLNNLHIHVSGTGYHPHGTFSAPNHALDKRGEELLTKTLTAAALCNDARLLPPDEEHQDWYVIGDPTEGALVVCGQKRGLDPLKLAEGSPRLLEFPFDGVRKMMTTVHAVGEETHAYVKGAPDVILERCSSILLDGRVEPLTPEQRKHLLAQNDAMAHDALRVLAIASRNVTQRELKANDQAAIESDLVFMGLLGMMDPARDEVYDAVQRCHQAGIRTIIITGDSGITAKAVGIHVGIVSEGARVITGEELDHLRDDELKVALSSEVLFARVAPHHKLRIVQALQALGERVAVTGDGVNDAPALKQADIGVAMGISGTDVAKESSDMILTDDSFASIVAAIEEGRGVYDNIKKTVLYALSGIAAELFVVLFAIFAGLPLPITAVQILWIDLGTEVLPGLALGTDSFSKDVMRRKPRPREERLLGKHLFADILLNGLFIAAVVMGLFLWFYRGVEANLPKAMTIAFSMIIFLQMVNAFNCRDRTESLFSKGLFTNRALWFAIFVSVVSTMLLIQVPFFQPFLDTVALSGGEWALMGVAALSILVYGELLKLVLRHYRTRFKIAHHADHS